MQPRDLVRVLRHGWPLMVLLLLVGAALGGSAVFLQRPTYVATAKAYVFVSSATTVGDLANSTTYAQQVAASFADIAGTAYVLRPVIGDLGLDETPASLAQRVDVTAVTGESVLQIQATDTTSAGSARVANAIADRLTTTVRSLTPATSTATSIKATVIDPAVAPSAPVSPQPALYLTIGAVAGLVVAIGFALLRALLDNKVRTPRDVDVATELPLLGSIPFSTAFRAHPVALGEGVQGPLAETYRSLRTALQFLQLDDGLRSMVVTSSVASEGKTVTSVNVAVALAEAGERVVLVDADLRRPSVSALLGLEGTIGLTDVLIGQVELDAALQTADGGDLTVLPSGTVPPNPNELLQTRALSTLLEQLESRFDRVVIDGPPVLPVSDAAILAHRTSGAVLVASAGRVKRAQLTEAVGALLQTGAVVLGVVLTMVPARESAAVTSGGYYRHAGHAARSGRIPVMQPRPEPAAASAKESVDVARSDPQEVPSSPDDEVEEPQPAERQATDTASEPEHGAEDEPDRSERSGAEGEP